ncbi:MAG: hypothetical protein GF350_07670 [Chitinivibrionales bacterium]|nr:hypothetical protein [Chitinivibrionales bacterium]
MRPSALLNAIVVTAIFSVNAGQRGYGDPLPGYPSFPSWRERGVHLWTNACRIDPAGFRDRYIGNYSILLPSNYPRVGPLYRHIDLNRAARFHASEMANDCGMQHESCDGTSAGNRIRSYYSNSSSWGENIATSRPTALRTVVQWLMDGDPPAADDPGRLGADGHRTNIMNANFNEIGAGYGYGLNKWYHFWVQDFSGGTSEYAYHPIPSGTHAFLDSSGITFCATYYDSAHAPRKASVVVDNEEYEMSLVLGDEDRGTYMHELDRSNGCRPYYFLFTDSQGNSWRYPEGGVLVTCGEGGCTEEYAPAESLLVATRHRSSSTSGLVRQFVLTATALYIQLNSACSGKLAVSVLDPRGKIICTTRTDGCGAEGVLVSMPDQLPCGCCLITVSGENGAVVDFRAAIVR